MYNLKRDGENSLAYIDNLILGKCNYKAMIKVQIVLPFSSPFDKDLWRSSVLRTVLKTLYVNIPIQLYPIDAISFSVCPVYQGKSHFGKK